MLRVWLRILPRAVVRCTLTLDFTRSWTTKLQNNLTVLLGPVALENHSSSVMGADLPVYYYAPFFQTTQL